MAEGMSVRIVVMVRHGQTEWSQTGRHTGRTDVPLTAEGRREAATIGERLGGRTFSLVLTSPLSRASETCKLAGFGARAQTNEDLREWDYGSYEGLTTEQVREHRPGWSVLKDGAPGGEVALDVGKRADRVLEVVRAVDGPVLLFAHGHVLRVIGARWIGLPSDHARFFALSTASISILGYERETPVLLSWNDTSHFATDRVPASH